MKCPRCSVLTVLLLCAWLGFAVGTPAATLPAFAQGGKMTEQGTPRSEILVMD